MNRRLIAALMFVATIVMACNGSEPGVEAAPDASAAAPTFSAEEFKRKVLDIEPKGMAIRFDSQLADVVTVESVTVEAQISNEPEEAARMVMRMVGERVVQIEVVVKGTDLYLRGGIDDDFGDWMKSHRGRRGRLHRGAADRGSGIVRPGSDRRSGLVLRGRRSLSGRDLLRR